MNKAGTFRLSIWAVVLLSALVRIFFIFKGAALFAPDPYRNGDTDSYTDSFLNLYQYGHYTFCLSNPEASFGRLPGYPFFWGLVYLLSSPQKVYLAVAVVQALLDTFCTYIIYKTTLRLSKDHHTAFIAALLHATYLFLILWIPVSGTEAFATDCCILFIALLTRFSQPKFPQIILLGITGALCFYAREYLAMLPVLACIGWLLHKKDPLSSRIRIAGGIGLVFLLCYALWPLRNYQSFHRIVLLKDVTAGYKTYSKDYHAFRSWIYAWDTQAENYTDSLVRKNGTPDFPQRIFANQEEHSAADSLVREAQQYGQGFYYWKHPSEDCFVKQIDSVNRNKEIAAGFDQLRASYIKRHPFEYYITIPAKNLKKQLFKSSLLKQPDSRGKAILITSMFLYRSVLLLFGIIGLFIMPRSVSRFVIGGYFVFIYLFIALIIRQTEMRYLIQADVLLLIPAAFTIAFFFNKVWPNKHKMLSNT